VEHYYPLVIRIVRNHLPRRSAEEDLAQEIFLKMFTRLDQYRREVPFAHWLSRVALTTCLDALRAQKRRPEVRWADLSEDEAEALERCGLEPGESPSAHEDPHAGLAARELVWKLLETLKPQDRQILTLLDLEGRSVAEISTVTGLSHSLVKVRAFRARQKLRAQLVTLERS
jgi:RNA polymerase sigma-70 factor (ECF subfamily)